MLLNLVKINLLLFIFFSGFTITYGEAGKGILGRVAIPDIFGAIFIILYFFHFIMKKRIYINTTYLIKYLYVFILVLTFGVFLASRSLKSSLIEILILFFELLILTIAFDILKDEEKFIKKIFITLSLSLIFVSVYGIYDMIAQISGLPVLIKKEVFAGCASSTFRNCGQAGAFSLVFTFVLLALYNSKLINAFSKVQKSLILSAIIVGIIFLLLTVKVASYVGFIFGIILFSLFNLKHLNIKYFAYIFAFILVFFLFYNFFSKTQAFEIWHNWYNYKIESRTAELEGESEDSFLFHNWNLAERAFLDNPLLGSGLGGFAGVYDKFEVHSTPFKFLGETGVLGLIFYIGFIYFLIFKRFLFAKRYFYIDEYADFIYKLYPLFLGLMVNWIYTYHFRKREFWIMLIILELSNYYMWERVKWDWRKK